MKGKSPNLRDPYQLRIALNACRASGNIEECRAILEAPWAHPDWLTPETWKPSTIAHGITNAVESNSVPSMDIALDRLRDVDSSEKPMTKDLEDALILAIKYQNRKMMKMLLVNGATVNSHIIREITTSGSNVDFRNGGVVAILDDILASG